MTAKASGVTTVEHFVISSCKNRTEGILGEAAAGFAGSVQDTHSVSFELES